MTTAVVSNVLLHIDSVGKDFLLPGGSWFKKTRLRAVDNETLRLNRGQVLAIVGESGCGKSTLAGMITGIHTPSRGRVLFDGADISDSRGAARRASRRRIQIVFQNPAAALDSRMTILQQVREGLDIHRLGHPTSRSARALKALAHVGLTEELARRYPHQLSGGQQQRAAIARAIVTEPDLLVLDEAVSALDVSVKAQIINLLKTLQRSLGLSYVFISHDLAVVRQLCDTVAVMLGGRVVEMAPVDELFRAPRHPFTRALIAAVPDPDPDKSFAAPPTVRDEAVHPHMCQFVARCPHAVSTCRADAPARRTIGGVRELACFVDPFAPQAAVVAT